MGLAKNKLTKRKRLVIYAAITVAGLIVLAGGFYGLVYASTPAHIRQPTNQHYHFRAQIVVDSKSVDFSKDEFQEKYDATTCSAEVGGVPIDFHDKTDQLAHVHWNGMTGGEFLKYYGWNYIGGNNGVLGQRYDAGIVPTNVEIYGKLLPNVPEKANFYVYAGDASSYQQKSWNDFLQQDMEVFFNKKSSIGHNDEVSFNVLDWIFPKAYAHGGVVDEHATNKSTKELEQINNLIGNVVIFVQQDKPSDAQIKAKFNNLVPLHESTCGG